MSLPTYPSDVNLNELVCLSYATYQESSNQGFNGKLAVANTIKNRTNDSRYPETYCKVVKQRTQYSFWRKRVPLDEHNQASMDSMHESVKIALMVISGEVPDNTKGATSFINMKIATDKSWLKGMRKTVIIEDHTFLKHKKES